MLVTTRVGRRHVDGSLDATLHEAFGELAEQFPNTLDVELV